MTKPLILLVEDEPWLSDAYARDLSIHGFAVHQVSDGRQAIIDIDQQPPTLIVLDLLLPYGNGLQLLHELQSYSDLMRIPVIICSSITDRLVRNNLGEYGVKKVVEKITTTPAMLRTLIQKELGL